MKKITLALALVVVSMLFTSQAFAKGPQQGKGKVCGPCREAVMDQLKLTDTQKAKMETLQSTHFKATRPLRDKIFDKSVELHRLWLQANPDKNKISAAQRDLRTMRDELEDQATAHKLDILQTLTPEQREKLANSGWGRGEGFGPRGGMRAHDQSGPGFGPGPGLGMGMCR